MMHEQKIAHYCKDQHHNTRNQHQHAQREGVITIDLSPACEVLFNATVLAHAGATWNSKWLVVAIVKIIFG